MDSVVFLDTRPSRLGTKQTFNKTRGGVGAHARGRGPCWQRALPSERLRRTIRAAATPRPVRARRSVWPVEATEEPAVGGAAPAKTTEASTARRVVEAPEQVAVGREDLLANVLRIRRAVVVRPVLRVVHALPLVYAEVDVGRGRRLALETNQRRPVDRRGRRRELGHVPAVISFVRARRLRGHNPRRGVASADTIRVAASPPRTIRVAASPPRTIRVAAAASPRFDGERSARRTRARRHRPKSGSSVSVNVQQSIPRRVTSSSATSRANAAWEHASRGQGGRWSVWVMSVSMQSSRR